MEQIGETSLFSKKDQQNISEWIQERANFPHSLKVYQAVYEKKEIALDSSDSGAGYLFVRQ
jgi:uncharacterized protein YozE (UPF0346 family)